MTLAKLQSLLPDEEIHHISESEQFFIDNNLNPEKFKNNKFILFEYIMNSWSGTLKILDKNNIKYSIHTDELDLDYIVI